jgi:hypothetical protein
MDDDVNTNDASRRTGGRQAGRRRWVSGVGAVAVLATLVVIVAVFVVSDNDPNPSVLRQAGATEELDTTTLPRISCNGHEILCDRPFNETVFAGTHNSMAADHAWGVKAVALTTQTYTIREQLDRGIRALSLDTWYAYDTGVGVYNDDGPTRKGRFFDTEPYLCHTLCVAGNTRLEDGLRDVVAFLKTNPHEVVVIYFEDYVSVQDTAAVIESSGLAPYVFNWSGPARPYSTTLRELIESGTRVVLISQNVNTANQTAWYPRLTSLGTDTDYDFSTTDRLTDPAVVEASCRPTPWGRSDAGKVFVMQHFITNLIASKNSSRIVNASNVIIERALACRASRGLMPTIVLVDYFELPDLADGVIRAVWELNQIMIDHNSG